MSWKCECGIVNKDSKGDCRACGTPRGMVWTPEGFKTPQEADAERNTYPDQTKKRKHSLWPKITDLESAKVAARQGFWAAIIVAGITAAIGILASEGFQLVGFEVDALEVLYTAMLFAFIAWGIQRMSRAAAIAGLTLYVLDRISTWSVYGFTNPVLPVIFTLGFINSTRGTFAYHKMMNSKVNVRNVLTLNVLGLMYSLIGLVALFIEIDIESMDENLLGFVTMSVVTNVYALSLMRFMPFTKERRMINSAESSPATVELRRQDIASEVKARENVSHTGGDITPIGKDPEYFYRECPRCAEQIHLEAIRCRYCDLKFEPEEVGSSIAPIVDEYGRLYDISSEVKQCPGCAETVKVGAFICRYCKQEFTPTEMEISKMKALREKVHGVRRKLEAKQVR